MLKVDSTLVGLFFYIKSPAYKPKWYVQNILPKICYDQLGWKKNRGST